MLKPGVYVIGRAISGLAAATHQYIVLVPEDKSTIKAARKRDASHYSLLGAYNVDGYLRARAFADSDHDHFLSLKNSSSDAIQSAKFVICWVSMDDPIRRILSAYEKYRKHEGSAAEIRYPTISHQLRSDRFNSNSWAQSCIRWAAGNTVRGENDLPGLDLGRDRVIPKEYFV